MSINQIKQQVRLWLADQSQLLEQASANAGFYGKNPLTIGNTVYKAFMRGVDKDKGVAEMILDQGLFAQVQPEAESFAERHLEGGVAATDLAFLCRELTLAKREMARRVLEHDYSDRLTHSAPPAPKSTDSPELLKDVWEKYLSEMIAKGSLKERSETQYRQQFTRFLDIVGHDIAFQGVTKELARFYKEELLDYPMYRNKGKGRDQMTYQEVREVEERRLSVTTINADMTTVSGYLEWAKDHGYIESNAVQPMIIPRDKDDEVRDPFSQEDLKLIFSQPRFQGLKAPRQSTPVYEDDYWLPLLALFTGARIEELCRLRKKDIQVEGTTHYFELMPPDLASEMSSRKKKHAGKTKAAHRRTPIHPVLMEDLGFREFVESKPEGYLFVLEVRDTQRGATASRDFGRFKKSLGLESTKVFHSFRHTLRDTLTSAGVSGEFIKGLVGHSLKGDVTFDRYGSKIHLQPTALAPHLYRVDYSDVLTEVKSWGEIKDELKCRKIQK